MPRASGPHHHHLGERPAADRRQHTRVSLNVQVDVASDSNFFVGRTRDLSMGGLFIETTVPLPIGSTVSVLLTLKGVQHALDGEVTWALDGDDGTTIGVGVRFKYLTARAKASMLAFMKERAPVEFEMLEPEEEEEAGPASTAASSSKPKSPPPFPLPGASEIKRPAWAR